jgi:hypothetical protein
MAITGRADVDQQSFTKEKKYALVTISAAKKFSGEKGLFQMFKDNENIKGINTQPVVDELVPVIRRKLAQTGYFTSVPMKTIVNSPSYQLLAEDEKVRSAGIFSTELNVGDGYKYLADEQKLSRLARDLYVDGVICVNMAFSVVAMKSALGLAASNLLGGLPLSVGEKEYASSVAMSLTAYDTAGNLIWEDSTVKQAEPGDEKAIVLMDLSDLTDTNFEKMHPSAVLIGSYATDILIERFQSTMEGKKTSIFQKTKDAGSKVATQKES